VDEADLLEARDADALSQCREAVAEHAKAAVQPQIARVHNAEMGGAAWRRTGELIRVEAIRDQRDRWIEQLSVELHAVRRHVDNVARRGEHAHRKRFEQRANTRRKSE